ncbi:VOC family protein [Actinacidiphila rubida]|uniref:Glyoxalase/Bleomycin resistance protein/Dioxygenase superfamily protein n=1 Tax=Actinacidiphila rubida TaxID=310780 RepID=A0A1H8RND3_9ACTN|nr:VOC family protein [Actinacidiphila rubida]SEO67483.1 Glyoxalase/Bleomycin resistance protein/Dioxygenase superfamily protein [Actinacidiphila rubida]
MPPEAEPPAAQGPPQTTASQDGACTADARPTGPRLAVVVVFVRDLEESASFYCGLLQLSVVTRESTALVLAGAAGRGALVLRAIGPRGEHALGAVGVQYSCWFAPDLADLRRCEQYLDERSALVETTNVDDRTVVEGRDPDGLPVMIMHSPDGVDLSGDIMRRVYAW